VSSSFALLGWAGSAAAERAKRGDGGYYELDRELVFTNNAIKTCVT
jgi:hypothetical protein